MSKKILALFLFAALIMPGSLVLADEAVKPEDTGAMVYRQRLERLITEQTKEKELLPNNWDTYVRVFPSAKAESMPGRLSIVDSESEYSYATKLFKKLPFEFGLGMGYIGIDNTTEVKLPAHLNNFTGGFNLTFPAFSLKNLHFRTQLLAGFYADKWDLRPTGFKVSSQNFFIYQLNEKLTLILGAVVYSNEKKNVWPIIGLIYKPNKILSFNILPKKPNINYCLSEKLDVFAEFDFSNQDYKVKRDDLGMKNASLNYKEMHLGLGTRYKFNKYLDGIFSVGSAFNRRLQYDDSLGKVNIKNGLYTEFRVESSF